MGSQFNEWSDLVDGELCAASGWLGDLSGVGQREPMKEYKLLRESEPNQPSWAAENTRDRLEKSINELARAGWIVKSFQANQLPAGPAFGFRPTNLVYFVLLEREKADAPAG